MGIELNGDLVKNRSWTFDVDCLKEIAVDNEISFGGADCDSGGSEFNFNFVFPRGDIVELLCIKGIGVVPKHIVAKSYAFRDWLGAEVNSSNFRLRDCYCLGCNGASGAKILFEVEWGEGEYVGDVVKTVTDVIAREVFAEVALDIEEVADCVVVFVAVESANCNSAWVVFGSVLAESAIDPIDNFFTFGECGGCA